MWSRVKWEASPSLDPGTRKGTCPRWSLTSQLATWAREDFRMSLSKGASSPFLVLRRSSMENRWHSSVRWLGACSNSFSTLPEKRQFPESPTLFFPQLKGSLGAGAMAQSQKHLLCKKRTWVQIPSTYTESWALQRMPVIPVLGMPSAHWSLPIGTWASDQVKDCDSKTKGRVIAETPTTNLWPPHAHTHIKFLSISSCLNLYWLFAFDNVSVM